MAPKALGLVAALGAVSLSGCNTMDTSMQPSQFRAPLFTKPPEADVFSAVLIARYAALNNDPGEAVSQYAAVLDDVPAGHPIAARGVFAALNSGDVSQAVTFAEKAAAWSDGAGRSALVDLTLAVDALSAGNAARAEAHLNQIEPDPFNRSMATYLRAWLTLDRDGYDAARAVLEEAEKDRFALFSVTLAMDGLMQVSVGRDEAALATFERLAAIGPRLAVATEVQARLLAQVGRADEARSVLARFRTEVGRNPDLEALDKAIVGGQPVSVNRLTLDEGAAMAVYLPTAALAARSGSDLPGVYFALALALDPGLDMARTLWADRLDQNDRRMEAIAILDRVPPQSAFYATAQAQKAWAQRREGLNTEALDTVAEALSETQDRSLAIHQADLLASLGDHDAAASALTTLIEDDAARGVEDWRLLLARGTSRDGQGDWTGAERDLKRAFDLAPDNPDIMTRLGNGWVHRQHNLEAAVSLLERAVALKPDAGHVIGGLGWAYAETGRYEEAITHLERAVALDPTSAVDHDHLGDAYWQVGRQREATFQWERALSLATSQPGNGVEADRLRRKIASGEPANAQSMVGASLARPDGLAVQP